MVKKVIMSDGPHRNYCFSKVTFVISSISNTHGKAIKLGFVKAKICGALYDLVPCVQFKKREKHPWRSVTFSKVAGLKPTTLLKLTLLHRCFPRF